MMKNWVPRAAARGSQSSRAVVIRHLSAGGSSATTVPAVPSGSKSGGGRFLMMQSQKNRLQFPAVVAGARSLGGIRGAHDDQRTKGDGDEELLGFLEEEIATEKKMQRSPSSAATPSTFEGFSVQVDKSEMTLTKKFGNEEIILSCNVNHSVDAEFNEDPNVKQPAAAANNIKDSSAHEMRSKPSFDVEIKRGNHTLRFKCSYLQNAGDDGDQNQEEFSDIFAIDEVCTYEGECQEKDYAVAGDILDGYLYDLFMNLLEERGISNEFADKFSDLCTDYEHKLYVDLLVQVQKFLGNN